MPIQAATQGIVPYLPGQQVVFAQTNDAIITLALESNAGANGDSVLWGILKLLVEVRFDARPVVDAAWREVELWASSYVIRDRPDLPRPYKLAIYWPARTFIGPIECRYAVISGDDEG